MLKKSKRAYSRKKAFKKKDFSLSRNFYQAKLKKPKNKINILGGRSYLIIGLLIIVGIFYFLFFSDFFKINRVIVNNNNWVSEPEIEKIIDEDFQNHNFIFVSAQNIFAFSQKKNKERILENKPVITQVQFKKEFPNVLRVFVEEREIAALWNQNGRYYYLSKDGTLCQEASIEEVERKKFPIIQNNQEKDASLGEEITLPRIVNFIVDLQSQFESEIGEVAQYYSMPTAQANEVHVKTGSGYLVYLSLEHDIKSQLQNLKLVLEKTDVKQKIESLEYIDLRVGSWVYFK